MSKDNHRSVVLLEAHRQFAQAKRLGLEWDWPRAMRFAHHKIIGKRKTIEARMLEIRQQIEELAFEPGPYGRRKTTAQDER